MKNQILLLALFIIGIGFTSCSTDDGSTTSQDEIIGTWKIIEQTLGGEDFTDECTFEKRYHYSSDGTAELTDQSYSEPLNACLSSLVSGSWENMGNNTYHFEYHETQPADFQVTFSSNGNMMTFSTTLTIDSNDVILQAIFQKI